MAKANYSRQMNDFSFFYLRGRPVWGPHLYDPETYAELRDQVIKEIRSLRKEGGVLVLPFQEDAERSLLIFLNILAGSLFSLGERPFFSQFLGEPYLESPEESGIWLIHHAPRFKNVTMSLESWIATDKVALATGIPEMWEQYYLRMPFVWLSYFIDKKVDFGKEEAEAIGQTKHKIQEKNLFERAHLWVAMCDAWGVPLPLDLLASILKADADDLTPIVEEAYQKGILFWVEREKPAALLISTRSESYARKYVLEEVQRDNISLADYHHIWDSINPEEREERYVALKLFQTWLTNSRYRLSLSEKNFRIKEIRGMIQKEWNLIKQICFAGNASEELIWAQCLSQIGLYDLALEIFTQALEKSPENGFLLQAKAHMLSKWASINPQKREDASGAFSQAAHVLMGNPYVWQAWGVFEAERGNGNGAEACFEKALQIDRRNLCSLVARADMNLERGFLAKVKDDLEKARAIAPQNLYVKHISGRLNFYSGKWTEAEKEWEQILTLENRNMHAIQSLGHMARERGQWDKARKYLERALNIDPENVPTLIEKALLEMDEVEFVPPESPGAIYEKLQGGGELLNYALDIEPANPKVMVTLAVIERKMGKVSQSKERLTELVKIWPNNLYARHALALCFLEHGEREDALGHLQEIIRQSQGKNLLPYITMAEISAKDGEKDRAKRLLDETAVIYKNISGYLPIHQKISALLERARLLLRIGYNKEAEKVLIEARGLDPENGKIRKQFQKCEEKN
jgi:tetratricopeptide (TPR) repeat protein